jgi:hypothetical protein
MHLTSSSLWPSSYPVFADIGRTVCVLLRPVASSWVAHVQGAGALLGVWHCCAVAKEKHLLGVR